MNISYDAYRFFYCTAKYRSFTKAAAVLGSSQPNVTRAIKNLEQALGCTLFLRDNRRVELTPEGSIDYDALKEAIAYIDGRAEIEVSGNVTKENIARLTGLGVDYVSSGALTHSAPILDISLKNLHPVEN